MIGTNDALDVKAELERFHQDVTYFDRHYDELLTRYPEQWVAVLDQEIVGVDTDLERLAARLRERGVPMERIYINRLTSEDYVLIV